MINSALHGHRSHELALGLIMAANVTAIVVVPTGFADNGNHYGQAKNGNNGKHNGGEEANRIMRRRIKEAKNQNK